MIFICIPVFERLQLTVNCIKSIKRQTYTDYTIVVCEHSPNDTTYNELKKLFPEVVLLRGDESMWWTAATNKCVEYALINGSDDDYVFTLNNDTVLDNDCLKELVESFKDNSDGIIGCVNLFYDEQNKIEPSAQVIRKVLGLTIYRNANKRGEDLKNQPKLRGVNSLSGKGVLIPFAVFKRIGLYNDAMLPHYHADTEFTIRSTTAGFRLFICYSAKVYSHHKETGINAHSTQGSIKEFLCGFRTIRSTRHFITLRNKAMLLHGRKFPLYLSVNLIGITVGFLLRFFKGIFFRQ